MVEASPRIDAHVHVFPDRLALAVRAWMNNAGELAGGVLLADVAASVAAAGFDRAWALPYAHRAGVAESVNEWSAREVSRCPSLVAGATFHPADNEFGRLVHRALVELGLRVVKLHCSVGAFSPADPRLTPLWETAAETGAPVVVHAGQIVGGESNDDEVRQVVPVLEAHPRLRLILAHAGHPATQTALDLMDRFESLYVDLTPVWNSPVELDAADVRRFAGRLLFGSDAPNNPTPAEDQASRWRELLSGGELDQLMGGTANSLVP